MSVSHETFKDYKLALNICISNKRSIYNNKIHYENSEKFYGKPLVS